MAMGVVTEEEFEQEVHNSGVPTLGHITELPRPGRKNGDVNVPDSLKKIIGETHELEGRQAALDLAHSLGVSPSSVSAYANGADSTASYHKSNPEVSSHIKERKTKVVGSALTRLSRAMGALTKDKIATSSAREISAIAKDMAQVVKLMDDDSSKDNGNRVPSTQFVVYAPTMIDERKFEVIQAKE